MSTKLNFNTKTYNSFSLNEKPKKDLELKIKGFKDGTNDDGKECLVFDAVDNSTQNGMNGTKVEIKISKSLLRAIVDFIFRRDSTENPQKVVELVMNKISNIPEKNQQMQLIKFISSSKGQDELNFWFSTLMFDDKVPDESLKGTQNITINDIKFGRNEENDLFLTDAKHREKIADNIFNSLIKAANT